MRPVGAGEGHPDDKARPWAELLDAGVLWAINRTVFHPRGFALAIEAVAETGEVTGWSLQGDGSEPWKFNDDGMEDARFAAFEALLAGRRSVQP